MTPTTRDIENRIDELKEEGSASVSPSERLELAIKSTATGEKSEVKRIVGNYSYSSQEPEGESKPHKTIASLFSQEATYQLEKDLLKFELARLEGTYDFHLWVKYGDQLGMEEPTEENAFFENDAQKWAKRLYIDYHGYRRFAEDKLGVDINTFLSLSPANESVHDIDEVIKDLEERGWLGDETAEVEGDRVELDEAAESMYKELSQSWDKLR